MRNIYDKQILRIALPAIVANITVPLLGLVDTAIVGHMGSADYIGAVAVGSMIFNLVYWVFGFLRMGTSGMTAQARGRRDFGEATALLKRSLSIAMMTATVLLVLQWPLRELMLWFISPTPEVSSLAVTYYNIAIWGAPAMLCLYGLTGWFIGMQNTHTTMLVSICQNIVNIITSLALVYGLGMKVEGVALGTVVAQYAGLFMALAALATRYRRYLKRGGTTCEVRRFLSVNADIFLRTICLVAVNLYFTSAGARQGAVILAVNTLLLQLYLLFSYVMDGFAFAGEAIGGRLWGAGDKMAYRRFVKRLFAWSAGVTLAFTLVYVIGGRPFLSLLTDENNVLTAASDYVVWAWLVPAAGVAAFVWDGLFIGTTHTRGMLLATAIATAVFAVIAQTLMPIWGNHGLWLAMLSFLLTRGVVQSLYPTN